MCWLPKTDRPKDGQHVDIFVPVDIPSVRCGPGRIVDCFFDDGFFFVEGCPIEGEDAEAISHWMPTPNAPSN